MLRNEGHREQIENQEAWPPGWRWALSEQLVSVTGAEETSLPKSSNSLGPDVGRITSDGSPLLLGADLPPSQLGHFDPGRGGGREGGGVKRAFLYWAREGTASLDTRELFLEKCLP